MFTVYMLFIDNVIVWMKLNIYLLFFCDIAQTAWDLGGMHC